MSAHNSDKPRSRHPVMAAVVLGTALSALGAQALGAAEVETVPSQSVRDIGRYCTSCWRNARLPVDAWGDCTQEVFARLLSTIPTTQWQLALHGEGDERREFLRAIDAVKKRVQRSKRYADGADLATDNRDDSERRRVEDRELVSKVAEEVLSPRQQRILQLSFEGYTAQEISDELVIPVDRVSDEKYKAIRKLRQHLSTQES